jgi:four helix bundle protein
MADPPPFSIRFRYLPPEEEHAVPEPEPGPEGGPEQGEPGRHDRAEVYQQALDFAARAYAVLERAEGERFYLRDQLDRKSAVIPQLIAQGLATADMALRRALYQRARQALTDCAAILDILMERRLVELEVLEPARALALALLDKLLELTVPPPKVW